MKWPDFDRYDKGLAYDGIVTLAHLRFKLIRLAPICLYLFCCPLLTASDAPQLLPDADKFRLTLVEDRNSTLPLGPSCTGEAEQTLTCRAFTLTLENLGKKVVRISWGGCNEPEIRIDRKEPNSSSGWWPVSQIKRENCGPAIWRSIRLKPGEKNEYVTRLISSRAAMRRRLCPALTRCVRSGFSWAVLKNRKARIALVRCRLYARPVLPPRSIFRRRFPSSRTR